MYLKDLMIRRRSSSKENRAFTEKECGRQVCVTTKILFMSALHLMIPGKPTFIVRKILMNHGKNAASMGSIITHLCYLMKMGASIWDTVLMKCGY